MELNLFSMFKEETKEFEKEQKVQAEEITAAKAEVNAKQKADKDKIKKSESADKTNLQSKSEAKKEKIDPNKSILEDIKKYPEIVLKAYGNELVHFVGEDDIKAIKLEDLSDRLINEFSYQEFSGGITWHLVPNAEKTVAYLVATGKFYSKG